MKSATRAMLTTIVPAMLFSVSVLSGGSASASSVTLVVPESIVLRTTPTPQSTFTTITAIPTVKTDNYTGYTLSMYAGPDSATIATLPEDSPLLLFPADLINLKDSTISVKNLTLPTGITFITGQTFSTTPDYNNMWAYAPNPAKLEDPTTLNFLPLPISTSEDAVRQITTNNTATTGGMEGPGEESPLTFAVKTNLDIPSGSYGNTITFSAVANPTSYSLTYLPNTPDATISPVSNMPSVNPQTGIGIVADTTITLSDATPSREDYAFLGWCLLDDSSSSPPSDANSNCNGTIFQPGADFVVDLSRDNANLNLYAIWEALDCRGKGIPIMQDIDADYISSMTKLTQVRMCDERDGKLYWVAKLADDHVWMTQNLDFELDTTVTLTPELSDIGYGDPDGNYPSGNTAWTPNNSTQSYTYKDSDGTTHPDAIWYSATEEDAILEPWNDLDHSYRPASDPHAGTSGYYGYDDRLYDVPVYLKNGDTMTEWKTQMDCINAGNSVENCGHWSVGTVYSWHAATAGTGNGDIPDHDLSPETLFVTDSICPKGWRIPTGNNVGDFARLIAAETITEENFSSAPHYFTMGIYEGAGAGITVSDTGALWTPNTYPAGAIFPGVSNTMLAQGFAKLPGYGIFPYGDVPRPYGIPLRCIAR